MIALELPVRGPGSVTHAQVVGRVNIWSDKMQLYPMCCKYQEYGTMEQLAPVDKFTGEVGIKTNSSIGKITKIYKSYSKKCFAM